MRKYHMKRTMKKQGKNHNRVWIIVCFYKLIDFQDISCLSHSDGRRLTLWTWKESQWGCCNLKDNSTLRRGFYEQMVQAWLLLYVASGFKIRPYENKILLSSWRSSLKVVTTWKWKAWRESASLTGNQIEVSEGQMHLHSSPLSNFLQYWKGFLLTKTKNLPCRKCDACSSRSLMCVND